MALAIPQSQVDLQTIVEGIRVIVPQKKSPIQPRMDINHL
jgi:hypothetical protein